MRRAALAVSLAMLLATPLYAAQATIAVVPNEVKAGGGAVNESRGNTERRCNRMWYQLFKRLGVKYQIFSPAVMRPLWASTGLIPLQGGKQTGIMGSATKQFDGVAHLSAVMGSNGNNFYRADSVLYISYGSLGGPSVPQFYAFNSNVVVGNSGTYSAIVGGTNPGTSAAGDSTTGVNVADDGVSAAGVNVVPGNPNVWYTPGSFQIPFSPTGTANKPDGGVRTLLSCAAANITGISHARNSNWRDSVQTWPSVRTFASTDSICVWERLYSGSTNKKAVFVYSSGNGAPGDSLSSSVDVPAEQDLSVMLYALAEFDSTLRASGKSLFDPDRLPLVRTITVDGLCSRGKKAHYGGIVPTDTTNFYAVIGDSLRLAGVPVLYGVNCDTDSMTAYIQDLRYAAKNPLARFTPELRSGLDTTAVLAGTGGTLTKYRPRDILGRYRNRTAVGDNSGIGADSSMCSGLLFATARLDSVLRSIGFGGRVEKFLLPPDDDWTPFNLINVNGVAANTMTPDSALFAIASAGFYGVRVNTDDPSASLAGGPIAGGWYSNEYYSPKVNTNPLGRWNYQTTYREPIGGNRLKMVGHGRSNIFGSQSQWGYYVPGATDTILYGSMGGTERWSSFTQDYDFTNADAWPGYLNGPAAGIYEEKYMGTLIPWTAFGNATPRPSYSIAISCNDLSGAANPGGGDPPARNGWWEIKWMNNAFNAINAKDGRPVIRFGMPVQVDVTR